MTQVQRFAAIDIGSNSLLLTIIENNKPYKILIDEAHVTGLAKGLSKDGLIQNDRLQKSLLVFKRFRQIIDELKVDQVAVAATEAMRKAKNGLEVRETIERTLGYPVQLISGEREAELSYWSVQHEYPDPQSIKTVFDIGGASTELALGGAGGIERRISLKVGSVLLTEKFQLDKASDSKEAMSYLNKLLLESKWSQKQSIGIGVAGTITTLFSIHKKLKSYDRSQVHGQKMNLKEIEEIATLILSKDDSERKNIPGLSPDRSDVFGGGICIIIALMKFFEWNEICCMDLGVRFGLLHEMMNARQQRL